MSGMTRPAVGLAVAALLALIAAGTVTGLRSVLLGRNSYSDAAPTRPASAPQEAADSGSHVGGSGPNSTAGSAPHAPSADDSVRRLLLERANQNDLSAQAELCRQDIRSPVAQVVSQAHFWCSVAAQAGDPASERYYADLLREGAGVPKDEQAALEWYERAAKHQDTGAMYALGNILLDRNTQGDEARGLGWIQQAARKGDSRAIALLQRRGATSEPHYAEQSDFEQGAVR